MPRQSHTKQLASGSKRDKPSVEVPDEFKQGLQGREGLADRILKAKEEERERIRLEDERRKAKERRAAEKVARKAKQSSAKRSAVSLSPGRECDSPADPTRMARAIRTILDGDAVAAAGIRAVHQTQTRHLRTRVLLRLSGAADDTPQSRGRGRDQDHLCRLALDRPSGNAGARALRPPVRRVVAVGPARLRQHARARQSDAGAVLLIRAVRPGVTNERIFRVRHAWRRLLKPCTSSVDTVSSNASAVADRAPYL